MVTVKINAGVCGFNTTVEAESEDGQIASLRIKSECPNYTALESELTEADAFEVCFGKIGEGAVYDAFRNYCKHAACPVPCGVIKAVEAECGLALPRDAVIEVSKD